MVAQLKVDNERVRLDRVSVIPPGVPSDALPSPSTAPTTGRSGANALLHDTLHAAR